jgi:hypothetical protein
LELVDFLRVETPQLGELGNERAENVQFLFSGDKLGAGSLPVFIDLSWGIQDVVGLLRTLALAAQVGSQARQIAVALRVGSGRNRQHDGGTIRVILKACCHTSISPYKSATTLTPSRPD